MGYNYAGHRRKLKKVRVREIGRNARRIAAEVAEMDAYLESRGGIGKIIDEAHAKIISELPEGERVGLFPCTGCRTMVQSDEHGNWYCKCVDERPNAEGKQTLIYDSTCIVSLPRRILKMGHA